VSAIRVAQHDFERCLTNVCFSFLTGAKLYVEVRIVEKKSPVASPVGVKRR
jgi:hypothetical protein